MRGRKSNVALNWVGGEWIDSADHRPVFDPATGKEIGTYAHADAELVERAVDTADQTFRESDWRHDRQLRSKVLNSMADCVEQRQKDLIELLALNNGKITPEATFEVSMVPSKLRWWAAMALTEQGRASAMPGQRTSIVVREPVGVAGIIVPFNSPVILAVRSLAPALAAGTTAVVKFPEETALINSLFAEVISESVGLPAGVISAVNTDREAGAVLIESPKVPVISFTGSTATGRRISEQGAGRLKRFGLELGGKTPMILCESADLDQALPTAQKAITVFAGQFCMAGSRLLVHRSIADKVRKEMTARLSSVKAGPASDPTSEMGPLINESNVERVNAAVERAIEEGAKVLVRGGPSQDPRLAGGAFYEPTLLEVSDQSSSIVQKETFGPVLTLQVFDTEKEAIAMANDSEYGLSASVWSRDVDQPMRIAHQLESGTVWINDWAVVYDGFEEGGYKQSGAGRLNGTSAMDDFLEFKHIAMGPSAH
ncbi:aldehyde dehydrogenase family protein [Streptomyces misionensis]|uniref:aldehyde dehydrogenase family protein n=1 Tax=Streptomyces misionensis TaxID=67331 RepID=UPI0033C9C5A8